MASTYAAKTPAKEVKAHRQVRLAGEIVRPPYFTDLMDDKIVIYPSVRPLGEAVGFVYQVISRDRKQRYHVAHYFDGRTICHCRAAMASKGRRNCWHRELVRERKARDQKGAE